MDNQFIKEFLKDLLEFYPEKSFVLLELNFNDAELNNYIITNSFNIHSFDPSKFKHYLNESIINHNNWNGINVFDSTKSYAIGEIVFDNIANEFKVLLSTNNWVTISK